MSENHPNNGIPPRKGGSSGGFKLQIDERDLATGSFDPAQYSGGAPRYTEPAPSKTAYYTSEKDRKAEQKAHKKRNRLKARKNKRIFSLVWVCMVVLCALTLASYLIGGSNDFFAVGRNQGAVEVEINEEMSPEKLADLLYQRGAIKKPEFFYLYSKITVKKWDMFKPGKYQVDTNLDYEDLINTLQGGNEVREVVTVTFPEGVNAMEAGQLLEEQGVCTQAEFLNALNTIDFTKYKAIGALGDVSNRYYALEGYLFPDTYDFYKGEELNSVIGKLLNNFQNKMTSTVTKMIEDSGMSMDRVIILASIIQAEAANEADMYNVSAVLRNRLAFGADYNIYRLQCDSTTYYPYKNQKAVPETGALSYGKYDTYEIEGLPAGPICNPGMAAIMAALRPNTEGDAPQYLYFCHAEDGTAYYATNEWDHQANLGYAGLL